MIVYGDPSTEHLLPDVLADLCSPLADLRRQPLCSLDDLRSLLIAAGQVEQAVEDAVPSLPDPAAGAGIARRIRAVTDAAAAAFLACRGSGEASESGAARGDDAVRAALEHARAALVGSDDVPRAAVTMKVPEGFAFYALYPEQYAAAARRWHEARHAGGDDDDEPGDVLVVGVRSIGTSLSALVQAVLSDLGRRARRMTVRPAGHPFDRRVVLAQDDVAGASHALVVDEGPGLSGSSMAAVARALVDAGVDPGRISFLPGHGRDPGSAASDDVRRWWASTPRYVAPLDDLRWDGRSLRDELAARAAALCGSDDPAPVVEDLGGGLWRRAVWPDRSAWPAAFPAFEVSKFRVALADGRSVLWKFHGLHAGGAAAAVDELTRRWADGRWNPRPLGHTLGFVAIPWVDGDRLTRGDLDDGLLAHVARYIAAVRGTELTGRDVQASFDRLREMLYWNVHEAIGAEAAERTKVLAGRVEADVVHLSRATYGDGRLAPYEWVRTPAGEVVKVDGVGHTADHTVVGRQPLAWDVAGAVVEWGMDDEVAGRFIAAVREACGYAVPSAALAYYRAAYAAFRLGLCTMCEGMTDDEGRACLRAAAERYARRLEADL